MSQRPLGVVFALIVLAARAPGAYAQAVPATDTRRVNIGGDVSATLSPPDHDAYFNYTDYDRSALRLVRIRLDGEWHLGPRLSVLGAAELDNTDARAVSLYLRWRPSASVTVQAGRIPPLIGAFARRTYGRDNVLIGLPLAYQYLTSLRPDALPGTSDDLLRMRGRGWQPSFPFGSTETRPGLPLVSFRWDTGVQATWRHERLELAGAVTMGAPASPRVQDTNQGRQWSGRASVSLASGLTLGVSGARGFWIDRVVLNALPLDRRESAQSVVGTDAEFGRGNWLLRSEWIRSTFDLPLAGSTPGVMHLAASSAFAEARYRLHPRWQISTRLERLSFSDVTSATTSLPMPWDAAVRRGEIVLGFRATRQAEIRGGWQNDWRNGGRVHSRGYPALQVLYWF